VLQNDCADAVETFDDGELGFVKTMRAHIDTGVQVRFFFDKHFVRDVIGGMLFEPDTSDEKLEAALAAFKNNRYEPSMAERGAYGASETTVSA
jgi:hypothetical protein